MGIGTWHEVKPARSPAEARQGEGGPRSKLGRPGQHGGFKSNKRR